MIVKSRVRGSISSTVSLLLLVVLLQMMPLALGATELFCHLHEERGAAAEEAPTFIREFLSFSESGDSVIRISRVDLNRLFQQREGFRAGHAVYFELPAGERLTGFVESFVEDINGTLTLRARIEGSEFGYILISHSEGRYLGRISIPERGEYYQLMSSRDREHYLLQIDKSRKGHIQRSGPIIPPADTSPQRMSGRREAGPDDLAVIDLMIVYTPTAYSWAEVNSGGINNTIAQAMNMAQITLDNSRTSIILRLVLSRQVNHGESPNGSVELFRIRSSPESPWPEQHQGYQVAGYMDEIHLWRDQYGADLVAYFAFVTDCSGMAFLLQDVNGQPDYGFSLTNIQAAASSYTHIHEIGHNMGAHHHIEQNFQPGSGIFYYSSGWRWTGSDGNHYCSVMTYESSQYFSDNIDHVNVPYFSNPDVLHFGVETGHPVYADNARTLRETKHVVASYRGIEDQYAPLIRNYPNPFNETTTISFLVSEQGRVKIDIFNIKGQLVTTLLNEEIDAGMHTASWDGRDAGGRIQASGLYIYRVKDPENIRTRKMMLLK